MIKVSLKIGPDNIGTVNYAYVQSLPRSERAAYLRLALRRGLDTLSVAQPAIHAKVAELPGKSDADAPEQRADRGHVLKVGASLLESLQGGG